MREAYWLRSPMLRVLICKFGDKLKEIQISPEHGIHYVNLLRTDYLLRYGGAGVLEFFEWVGRAHHRAPGCAFVNAFLGGMGVNVARNRPFRAEHRCRGRPGGAKQGCPGSVERPGKYISILTYILRLAPAPGYVVRAHGVPAAAR